MKLPAIIAAAITIVAAITANAQNTSYTDPHSGITRSLVFNRGDFGSKFYRIPAITTLPDGTIIAVADKRIDRLADLPGDIDIVARHSTDGGRTWGPYITVAQHDSLGGYGDPALVYDRRNGNLLVISTHGQGLWQKQPGQISVSRSTDGGLTWLPPVDINPQILTTDPKGKQPIKCTSAFASSGAATQLKNGRIVFILVTRQDGVKHFPCYAIYSDDSGRTWRVSKNPVTLNGDETKTVQLADGTLLASIRNRYSGPRKVSISRDGARTWTEQKPWSNLHDVACNGDIIRYPYQGTDYLIQSLPAGPWRSNITLYASPDQGKTWPYSYRVAAAPGAYSAITALPDGSLGILTEEGLHNVDATHQAGYRIWFTRIPVTHLLPTHP